ncbi:MAG: 4Fe-4S dicluster domain-containing protein [Candidatus Helarchaeota archaeon]
MPDIKVDLEKCIGCGKCRDVCPKLIYEPIEMESFNGKIKYLPTRADHCLLCRICIGTCPKSAITIKEKKFFNKS